MPPPNEGSNVAPAIAGSNGSGGVSSKRLAAPTICSCGEQVDPHFINKLLPDLEDRNKCRLCKVYLLLHRGLEVHKYCYGRALTSRKRKVLRLSTDNTSLQFWPLSSSPSHGHSVSLSDISGVVFGAYTCTFKKQKAENLPPHWAAFSLISPARTYDFSAPRPEVVECCITGLQQALWQKRREDPSLTPPRIDINAPNVGKTLFKPWPLGFFLWMRLRFRLQEQAQKEKLAPDHMLWVIFMRCAFKSEDELSKGRFIDMAEKLQTQCEFSADEEKGEMKNLGMRYRFQKQRVLQIVEDTYHCQMNTFLPRAPAALIGMSTQAEPGRCSGDGQSDDQASRRDGTTGNAGKLLQQALMTKQNTRMKKLDGQDTRKELLLAKEESSLPKDTGQRDAGPGAVPAAKPAGSAFGSGSSTEAKAE
eukprot:gnl/TRDRNA2_/TRDRNA2_58994_c0_seq1.p1 gnl/TRDRNA2_/TRDRNA2_58994_c0~~gnl/TRDRNA2_/TRDRNA2_58994_c0_seq1.p1  ORF type:complete len:419 (+),score=73.07 gnl/TRDRNA2_/TRDRNA2_58994_c0_seq1:58-1314(+)